MVQMGVMTKGIWGKETFAISNREISVGDFFVECLGLLKNCDEAHRYIDKGAAK